MMNTRFSRSIFTIILPLIVVFSATAVLAAVAESPRNDPQSEWRIYGNDSGASFYSSLDQINDRNVRRLGLAWFAPIPAKDGPVGNALVADGVVYQSTARNLVFANDLRSGKLLWQFDPQLEFRGAALPAYLGFRLQRGLALEGDKVFIATADCRLIAIDRSSGRTIWEVTSCDMTAGQTQAGAPHVGGGLVFIGNSCMDFGGVRGFVSAYDQQSGRRKWIWHTVPIYPNLPAGGQESEAHEIAARTWGTGLTRQVGCASVWDSLTYDPSLNLLFASVGGADPWAPVDRAKDAGDELYAGSIVALRADTGEYVWHYKLAAHDGWNWEALGSIVTDLEVDGSRRHVLLNAPKNGFLYMLDAETGKFISAGKFTNDVNWASHIDPASGRPVRIPDADYWNHKGGAVVAPSALGAHSWQPMSYSPKTGLVYIPVLNLPSPMARIEGALIGGTTEDLYHEDPKHPASGALTAMDARTQTIKWSVREEIPINGGVISTGGNLVFSGTGTGVFRAFSADSGKLLWSMRVGGSLQAAPTTVRVDGVQYVLLPYGNGASSGSGLSFSKVAACPSCRFAPSGLMAFKLDGRAAAPPIPQVPPFPKPPLPRFARELADKGELLYSSYACEICHGYGLINGGGSAPDLRRSSDQTHRLLPEILRRGLYKSMGMPQFAELTEEELTSLQAFIVNGAWDAYEAQDVKPLKSPPHMAGTCKGQSTSC